MSVNKVILVGNVGTDPEVKTFENGGQIAIVKLATSESWKDKQTGEKREATEWHSLVFNGGLVGVVDSYVNKGDKLYVEGSIKTRKWQDAEGNDRYATDIRVRDMTMLGSKQSPQQSAPAPQPSQAEDFPADDIPF